MDSLKGQKNPGYDDTLHDPFNEFRYSGHPLSFSPVSVNQVLNPENEGSVTELM